MLRPVADLVVVRSELALVYGIECQLSAGSRILTKLKHRAARLELAYSQPLWPAHAEGTAETLNSQQTTTCHAEAPPAQDGLSGYALARSTTVQTIPCSRAIAVR